MSRTEFGPGQPTAGVPLAMTGEILTSWLRTGWTIPDWSGVSQIVLRVYDPAGRLLFEKIYLKVFIPRGPFLAPHRYRMMAGLLRDTVGAAMNDPDLLRELTAAGPRG